MKFIRLRNLIAFSVTLAIGISAYAKSVEGFWKGAIELPGAQTLGIEVKLEQANDVWSAQISIPVQAIRDYQLTQVSVNGNDVRFTMEGIPGTPRFEGIWNTDEDRIAGDFSQGGQNLAFALDRSDEAKVEIDVPKKGIPGEGVSGEWFGTLSIGPSKLRLALHVQVDAEGEVSGSLDSLDQGVKGLAFDSAAFDDSKFSFRINKIDGNFEATLNEDGSALEGTWTQMGRGLPLTFFRQDKPVSLVRPQEPKGQLPYSEELVSIYNDKDGLKLAGTLVIPEGEAPFPAVVFVSGSGDQDRDESLAGHRPFAVIADALARCGIASLRCDDRGVGESEGNHYGSTSFDFAQDALAAVHFLESRVEIDSDWLGILGHSEGGLVGPMAASVDDAIDFLILLAPPVEQMKRLLLRQRRDVLSSQGVGQPLIEKALPLMEEELSWITDDTISTFELKSRLRDRLDLYRETFTTTEMEQLGLNESIYEASVRVVSTKWFRALMKVDPQEFLTQVEVPLYAVFADKDIQVDAEVNASLLHSLIEREGKRNWQVDRRAGLNHLFQNCTTGAIDEYGLIEETFDPATLDRLCRWIAEHQG